MTKKNNDQKDKIEGTQETLGTKGEQCNCGDCDCEEEKGKKCDCEERIKDLENQVKRTLADYQNLEKRVREERHQILLGANKELLLRMLPVLDTLLLASKHSKDQALNVTTQQFLDVLKNEGVTKIETEGKEFDPNVMEAVTTAEGQENKVLEELRAGYKLGDQILRAAQVKVGSAKQNN